LAALPSSYGDQKRRTQRFQISSATAPKT